MKLSIVYGENETRYLVNGKEVPEKTYRAAKWKTNPPDFKNGECPGMHPDYADFTNETNEKTGQAGRYYGQLAKFPGDKRAYFKHKNDAIEAAKKRGWDIDDR